ncbi:outer membrane protein assembly factor BamB [Porticoccus sp.]
MKRLSWLLVACLMFSGCSSITNKLGKTKTDEAGEKIAPAELVDFPSEIQMRQLWSNHAVGKNLSVNGGIRPAMEAGVIYVADSQGTVAAVDAGTGERKWKVELDKTIGGAVGVGSNTVLVGSTEGDVFALEADSGEQRWHVYVTSEVLAAPGVSADVAIVQSQDGRVVGLNLADGSQRWQFKADVPVLSLRGTSPPVVTEDLCILSFANGKVHALSPSTGAQVWENRVATPQGRTELERMVDLDGRPVLVGDVLYAASYQGRIGALATASGRGIWYQDASTSQDLAYGLEQVYLVQKNDTVKALRASSGQQIWQNDQLTYRKLGSPAVVAGYMAVGDAEGYLHVLSQTDGRFVARTKVGAGVAAPMLVDGNILYVLNNGGRLTAYSFE